MNPFKSPNAVNETNFNVEVEVVKKSTPCYNCGSLNTRETSPIQYRPRIIFFLIIGWLYLLGRYAFSHKEINCKDCGKIHSYKTLGSWIALIILLLEILFIIFSS